MAIKSQFKKRKFIYEKKGALLLEALIAIMIIGIAFSAILSLGTSAVGISTSLQKTTEANSLLKEEIEAVRNFRDGTTWAANGLGVVATGNGNPHYAFLDTTSNPKKWVLVSGNEIINGFTRKIIFDKVSRDPTTKNIESVYNISHNDPDTIKATAIITWTGNTLQLTTYFTNWK